jgi:hypothetical protein
MSKDVSYPHTVDRIREKNPKYSLQASYRLKNGYLIKSGEILILQGFELSSFGPTSPFIIESATELGVVRFHNKYVKKIEVEFAKLTIIDEYHQHPTPYIPKCADDWPRMYSEKGPLYDSYVQLSRRQGTVHKLGLLLAKLRVNNQYKLKKTIDFCNVSSIIDIEHGYWTFVGQIETHVGGKRNIFCCLVDGVYQYCMFTHDNCGNDYIIEGHITNKIE